MKTIQEIKILLEKQNYTNKEIEDLISVFNISKDGHYEEKYKGKMIWKWIQEYDLYDLFEVDRPL